MNVAFIPVRGGSKSIPLKNIKEINGKPLVYWCTKAACDSNSVDRVYISTDSDKIKNTVLGFKESDSELFRKVYVIGRSAENATDTASTESVMLEFARDYEFDTIILIQATSPLLTGKDIDGGFELYNTPNTDSVLSVVRQKRFLWGEDENGVACATNYDVFHRPRRQDFDGYLMENGAFYIISKSLLLETHNRLAGVIRTYEMGEESALEIDEPLDFDIIERIMKNRNNIVKHDMPEIKMFITDCDGCLTDGGMYYSEEGDELKKFNTRDGMGISLLRNNGVIVGIITSEDRELNKRRAQKLKLDFIESKCLNKKKSLIELSQKYDIPLENVCYVGDDINDIEAAKISGFSACPADAIDKIRGCVDYVCRQKGGEGAIREVIDYISGELNWTN